MANLEAPVSPVIVWSSPASDIYPEFSWVTVTDPDTGPASIEYELKIYEEDGTTPVGSHMYTLGLRNGIPVTVSWMSGLVTGSYQAKLKAWDGSYYSGESVIDFIIKSNALMPDDVIVKVPVYVDPYLDLVRFWNKSTEGDYNAAKHTGEVILV